MIPYGKQSIQQDDIEAVVETLGSAWLTTGPKVNEFESAFAEQVGASHAVAVSNGTAALHTALEAAGVQSGAEVIVPAITFVATANAAIFQGATPVFADVNPNTLLVCPTSVRKKITPRTRAIIAVDFAGQPCDYNQLRKIADEHELMLISDSCHSLGAKQNDTPVGSLADLSCFSFHPVKPITTGEGGMITTQSESMAQRMKQFRSHGIDTDFRARNEQATHRYDMVNLGFNYRLTDLQAALGLSQLKRLEEFTLRRNEIAKQYDRLLERVPQVVPLQRATGTSHAFHLYVIKIDSKVDRDEIFQAMRGQGIGVNVHYRPVHLNSYYQRVHGCRPGTCPNAESAYQSILTLPIFPDMSLSQVQRVIDVLKNCLPSSIQSAAA